MRIILRLLSFLRPYSGWVVLSLLLSLATVASNIGLLGTSAYLIARAYQHPSIADLQIAIVGVRFFGILRAISRYLERFVSHSVNFHLLGRLRVWFFQKLEPLVPARTQLASSGDLLSQVIADIDTLQEFYVRVVAPFVTAALVTLGMGVILGLFDPFLSFVLLVGLLGSGLLLPLATRRLTAGISKQIVIFRSKFTATIAEFLDGLSDILILDATGRKIAELREIGDKYASLQVNSAWRGALISAINLLITNLTFGSIIFLSIPMMTSGQMDGVNFVVVSILALASFEAVSSLGPAAQNFQQALPAAERIFSMVEQEPLIVELENPKEITSTPDLVIDNLTFTYPGTPQPVLDGISLNLPFGKKIAIVGISGSGKSTLFSLLVRFWDCPPGRIFIGGLDIREISSVGVRSKFAILEQGAPVIAGTLRDNLLLGNPRASEEQLFTALREAGLEDWLKSLPRKLDTWIGERGSRVSGGEKQRIAIARNLLQDAPIMLLDEPLNNLDPENAGLVFGNILSKANRRSLIMATHSYDFLDQMDEILVLKEGKVFEKGTIDDLIAKNGEYSGLLGTSRK